MQLERSLSALAIMRQPRIVGDDNPVYGDIIWGSPISPCVIAEPDD
jgi:hypothetical protein